MNFEFLLIAGIIIFCTACERMQTYPDRPIPEGIPQVISHRGGGFRDTKGNSLLGCMYGFSHADGVECDIQKSKNGTIWLDHSSDLSACGSFQGDCFSNVPDQTIAGLNECLGPEKALDRLDSVLNFMKLNYPGKYISLDAKAWFPCKFSGINMIREMNLFGKAIIDVVQRYQLSSQVVVESENGDLLYYLLQNDPRIGTYLVTNGDLELGISRCLQGGFTGISFKYNYDEELTRQHVELLHRKGLRIQIWTVNQQEQFHKVMKLKPDFIQTDEVNFFPY